MDVKISVDMSLEVLLINDTILFREDVDVVGCYDNVRENFLIS